jgi:ribonuclease J
MAWTPIERLAARPETREHRLDAALVTFAVLLNRSPPEDWVAVFLHPPGRSRVIHELAVTGSTVTFTAERATTCLRRWRTSTSGSAPRIASWSGAPDEAIPGRHSEARRWLEVHAMNAFDAFALLVEACGKRLLYTGDFRGHGNDGNPFAQLLGDPPRDVHALMMEGTQLGDRREGDGPSEADLRRKLALRFREWPGLVLVAWSSQNLDRLRTVYEAAREAGRTLAVDLYTATLAGTARAPGVPVPGDERLEVFCRKRERLQVKDAAEFHRTRGIAPWRLFPEELVPRAREMVLMFRPSMMDELELAGALPGALAIWSMWRGYLTNHAEQRMQRALVAQGVPLEIHHVSGHAYLRDLMRLVDSVRPRYVVPIHTESPDRYSDYFPRVKVWPDGKWVEVE